MTALVHRLRTGWPAPIGIAPRRLLAMLGPGYMVAVGYMDPGNWATDIAAGARYGLALLSVVLLASLAAAFLQALAVRLTVATGDDLVHLIRARFSRPVAWAIWLVMEIAMVATDLAELLGGAIAFKLLLGLPLEAGLLLSAAATFLLFALPGARQHPAAGRIAGPIAGIVALLVAIEAASFAAELALARPDSGAILAALVPPRDLLQDRSMIYLSLGVLGATIMPHNLLLHSGLAKARMSAEPGATREAALRFLTADSWLALGVAFLVNGAILVLAASTFGLAHRMPDAGIEDAYRLLGPVLGTGAASALFAVGLLAAGQSSTMAATLAATMLTEGFLDLEIRPWLRSLITRGCALLPASLLPLVMGPHAVDRLLILSQAVLGLALPVVLLPMLVLLADRRLMRRLRPGYATLGLAGSLTVALILLNGWLAQLSVA
jgi:manganese transport protein